VFPGRSDTNFQAGFRTKYEKGMQNTMQSFLIQMLPSFRFLALNLRRYSLSEIADSGRVNIFVPNEKILIRMGGTKVRHVLGNKNIGGSV
jgi:hypothetical protein